MQNSLHYLKFFYFIFTVFIPLSAMEKQIALNPTEIVNKVIEQTGYHYLKDLYLQYERKFNEIKQSFPTYEIAGSLTYTMSLDEIIKVIKTKFRDMYQKGQIITQEDFNKRDQSKWFYKANDLTRIWGAEYLSNKFKEEYAKVQIPESMIFKVPRYIIVVNNLSNIKIKIHFAPCFPIVAHIENGTIYAEKIEGIPEKIKIPYGYTDYSGDNILKTNNGRYVIDTEYKSFYDALPEEYLLKDYTKNWRILCEYLKNRFELLNKTDGTDKIIEISVLSK